MKKGFIKHGELEQDFELNIASIIDCFVVLIAFVLISTSFFSIGILDAEVSSAGADQASANPAEAVVIDLRADHSIRLTRSGESERSAGETIAASGGKWDLTRMSARLGEMKVSKTQKAPESAVVMAENSVSYRDVMASMEAAKTQLSKVNLGGF